MEDRRAKAAIGASLDEVIAAAQKAIDNSGGGEIIREIAAVIGDNKAYLSEIDGLIGDGDHGVNLAKGFARAADRLNPDGTLSEAMEVLSDVLMSEIGGPMGPLYASGFLQAARLLESETLDQRRSDG